MKNEYIFIIGGVFMKNLQETFKNYLLNREKFACVDLILKSVSSNEISIVDAYERILTPTLREISDSKHEQVISIWEEHYRSEVVRTVIECLYPIVHKNVSQPYDKKAIVICPQEEYHELGARIVCDYLFLLEIEPYFIGANTPMQEIVALIDYLKPNLIAISISNFYSMISAQKLTENIRLNYGDSIKIVIGGYAVENTEESLDKISADNIANDFEQLKKIVMEV